jgi:branched-chain amino acid aminotransferase
VLDHGLLFGDSVYETLRTYNGKPFLFSRHFARLEHSAQGIYLGLPWSKAETFAQIQRTLLPGPCRIRLMVTRGTGGLTPDIETCDAPSAIIIATRLVPLPESIYEDGVHVTVSSVRRSVRFADIKTGSLIHQVLALREAKTSNAFEAILLTSNDELSDGITSNVYLVRDGALLTPSHAAGIVEGITRGVVLELARGIGIPVIEGVFGLSEIETAEEMFLTSTTREVVPVVGVDGKSIGSGRPGAITQRLLHDYRASIQHLTAED